MIPSSPSAARQFAEKSGFDIQLLSSIQKTLALRVGPSSALGMACVSSSGAPRSENRKTTDALPLNAKTPRSTLGRRTPATSRPSPRRNPLMREKLRPARYRTAARCGPAEPEIRANCRSVSRIRFATLMIFNSTELSVVDGGEPAQAELGRGNLLFPLDQLHLLGLGRRDAHALNSAIG